MNGDGDVKKLIALVCVLTLTACNGPAKSLSQVNQEGSSSVPVVETGPATTEVFDYAEVLRNSSEYDGKSIVVAGKIAEYAIGSEKEFFFRERLGFESDGNELGFRVCSLTAIADQYHVGDYVLVQGTWSHGRIYGSRLESAKILSCGSAAKSNADIYSQQWHSIGESVRSTLPVTDYMEICSNVEKYEGMRVRTVGQIQAIIKNQATHHISFGFRDRQTNYECISVSLKGCPQEMQDLCIEDEYVVISGVISNSPGLPRLSDCFIECVGNEAKNILDQNNALWAQTYQTMRQNYISSCATFSYEQLARFPDNNLGEKISVGGTVVQVDTIWGENVVLLNVGNNQLIYISYVGKLHSDPEILPGDQISFHGETAGLKTYTTILGMNRTIPLVIAHYSSINVT